jgi:hypothetical protein
MSPPSSWSKNKPQKNRHIRWPSVRETGTRGKCWETLNLRGWASNSFLIYGFYGSQAVLTHTSVRSMFERGRSFRKRKRMNLERDKTRRGFTAHDQNYFYVTLEGGALWWTLDLFDSVYKHYIKKWLANDTACHTIRLHSEDTNPNSHTTSSAPDPAPSTPIK